MNHEIQLYRIMRCTMVDGLFNAYGQVESHKLIRTAAHKAGLFFAEECLDLSDKLFLFIRQMQRMFIEMEIGTLRVTRGNSSAVEFILDCSRHSAYSYTMCCYGEGLLAGILEAYIRKKRSNLTSYVIRLSI